MRIDRLDLMAYGPFTGISLDLSRGKVGLHVIYGDNEAGKSTSLRALTAWLFGIPVRTRDNFLHSNSQLRIGGRIRLSDGRAVEFVRRKGNKDTILAPDTGLPLDGSVVDSFLSGVDEKLFRKLYGIDHERLLEGGRELLEQSGDIGQALFSAASGTENLRRILTDLGNEAQELFKPRGSVSIVNLAVRRHRDLKKKIRELTFPAAEWQKLQKTHYEISSEIAEVEKAISVRGREKSRLERLNRVKGPLAERRAVLQRLMELGEVLLLPENFEEESRKTAERLETAVEAREKAGTRLIRLQKEAGVLHVNRDLLENAGKVSDIYRGLGAVEKAIEDRPGQDGKRRILRNEAERLLKAVRPDLSMDDADILRPLLNNRKWLQGLLKQHGVLGQRKKTVLAEIRDLEEQIGALEAEISALPEPEIDIGELKAAVAAVRKYGDIEGRLADVRRKAERKKDKCETEFAALGRFSGNVFELRETPFPMDDTLSRFAAELEKLSHSRRRLSERLQDLEQDQMQAREELDLLLLAGEVPAISDLDEARFRRDQDWGLIRRTFIDGSDTEVREASEASACSEMADAYEKKVQTADLLADRIREAADLVVKRADLEVRLKGVEQRMKGIASDIEELDRQHDDVQAAWEEQWAPLGIEPGTPGEMKQWLLRVSGVLAGLEAWDQAVNETSMLAEQCRRLREDISTRISSFDASAECEAMSLETMLNLCEQRILQAEDGQEEMSRLRHLLDEKRSRLQRIREELRSVESERSDWKDEWSQAIDGLGLDPDCHPERAMETFERLVMFFEKSDKADELRRRLYGMDRVVNDFSEKVSAFAVSMDFDMDGQDAVTVAARLHRELDMARVAEARLAKINDQLRETETEIQELDITIRRAEKRLEALCRQAEVDSTKHLTEAWERSCRKRSLQDELQRLEKELAHNGDGLSVQRLEEEAEGFDMDAVQGELERVSLELEELQARRDGLRDDLQEVKTKMDARDGSAASAAALEEAEKERAVIDSGIEQYLRLQAGVLILEQCIEEYRKKNQAPVLVRAGKIFSRLTLGSFAGLRDEVKGGRPVLLGVRPDRQEISIEGMSEGARDQLYLALRLSTLEQHLRSGEPMPFIVDDILVGFDDRRTEVCLEVLAELAADTQVLLFTHHRRVLELAGKVGGAAEAGVYIHELG